MSAIRVLAGCTISLILMSGTACAQVTCIQTYIAEAKHPPLGVAASEISNILSETASRVGLSASGITIVPCDGVDKVQSNYYDGAEIPAGDYIVYDPTWVREVIGKSLIGSQSHDEAIVLFGHELGHLLGRHFTANKGMARLEKETQADHFAGCAAGVMNVEWQHVESLLDRIRGDSDTDYPSLEHSLVAAKDGYDHCKRAPSPSKHDFAAIAVVPKKGARYHGFGAANTKSEARQAALRACGQSACKIVQNYTKGDCAVIVLGKEQIFWNTDQEAGGLDAIQNSLLSACEGSDSECRLLDVSECL